MALDLRDRRVAGVPLLAGALNGALAFVAGYVGALVCYVVFGLKPIAELAATYGGYDPDLLTAAGFAYYGGHFVPVETGDGSTNFALDLASNGSLYVLLAVGVLVATGYYLGTAEGLDGPGERATAGAAVVLGYAPLAVAGLFAFTYEYDGGRSGGEAATATSELPVVRGVLLAAVVVPVVCGAVGGLLAELFQD